MTLRRGSRAASSINSHRTQRRKASGVDAAKAPRAPSQLPASSAGRKIRASQSCSAADQPLAQHEGQADQVGAQEIGDHRRPAGRHPGRRSEEEQDHRRAPDAECAVEQARRGARRDGGGPARHGLQRIAAQQQQRGGHEHDQRPGPPASAATGVVASSHTPSGVATRQPSEQEADRAPMHLAPDRRQEMEAGGDLHQEDGRDHDRPAAGPGKWR